LQNIFVIFIRDMLQSIHLFLEMWHKYSGVVYSAIFNVCTFWWNIWTISRRYQFRVFKPVCYLCLMQIFG